MAGMIKNEDQIVSAWPDYELIDSGENMKLERYGNLVVARPDTQALWKKSAPTRWIEAQATYHQKDGKGAWDKTASVPERTKLSYKDVAFYARLQAFKHVGVFPEQAANWEFITERTTAIEGAKVLNLFGYTGVASLCAVRAGAFVTHVDASHQSLDQANENAELSGLPKDKIRWIPDDALAFARREARRGSRYDGIILDPPAFGRGAKGQVWHIEEDLSKLLTILQELLSPRSGSFLVLNGYASGYSATAFAELVKDHFPTLAGSYGELLIEQKAGERKLPCGIFVRGVVGD